MSSINCRRQLTKDIEALLQQEQQHLTLKNRIRPHYSWVVIIFWVFAILLLALSTVGQPYFILNVYDYIACGNHFGFVKKEHRSLAHSLSHSHTHTLTARAHTNERTHTHSLMHTDTPLTPLTHAHIIWLHLSLAVYVVRAPYPCNSITHRYHYVTFNPFFSHSETYTQRHMLNCAVLHITLTVGKRDIISG